MFLLPRRPYAPCKRCMGEVEDCAAAIEPPDEGVRLKPGLEGLGAALLLLLSLSRLVKPRVDPRLVSLDIEPKYPDARLSVPSAVPAAVEEGGCSFLGELMPYFCNEARVVPCAVDALLLKVPRTGCCPKSGSEEAGISLPETVLKRFASSSASCGDKVPAFEEDPAPREAPECCRLCVLGPFDDCSEGKLTSFCLGVRPTCFSSPKPSAEVSRRGCKGVSVWRRIDALRGREPLTEARDRIVEVDDLRIVDGR